MTVGAITGSATLATAVCVAAVLGLLWAEWRGARLPRALCKTTASLAFVAVALAAGATDSPYGRFILIALVLGAVGDVLLLSDHSRAFLAGLGAFLASHVTFGVAFVVAGVAAGTTAIGLALAVPLGGLILRWLWPHLDGPFRAAVAIYVVVILGMCALAAGYTALHAQASILIAGLLFAASDLAVARDKFVSANFVNRLWGLPTYYAAQLLFAGSVQLSP